jgi:hypothetical protein
MKTIEEIKKWYTEWFSKNNSINEDMTVREMKSIVENKEYTLNVLDILADHEQKIAKLEAGLKQDGSPIPPDTTTNIYCRKCGKPFPSDYDDWGYNEKDQRYYCRECSKVEPPKFEGFEWTGEYRLVKKGEYWYDATCEGPIMTKINHPEECGLSYIYRRVEPTIKPDPRQIDIDVAKALGYEIRNYAVLGVVLGEGKKDLPPYSTDVATAIEAMEEYCGSRYGWHLSKGMVGWDDFVCSIGVHDPIRRKTKPLAICHAIIERARKQK